jgi:hypothetical protein
MVTDDSETFRLDNLEYKVLGGVYCDRLYVGLMSTFELV